MKYLSLLVLCCAVFAKDKPNILWLTCEDSNINWISCYGNGFAKTPNIDNLAKEGFQYMHCYSNAPVCAASRSTWITGINSISKGTHNQRSRYNIPHKKIKYYPDLIKEAGYYVGNYGKTDYNIGGRSDKACWNSSKRVDFNKLKQKQPFFQVINSIRSHESRAFGDVENTKHDPNKTKLAKYHPDLSKIRKNYARYHDQVARMDDAIGYYLKELEKSGLKDNTIVIFNSDHGGVLLRSKRYLYNSGTHCPFIIRIPEKYKKLWPAETVGSKIDELVSFVDMTSTWLSLTGAKRPEYLHGQVFLGEDKVAERKWHVSFRGRMDERLDNVRAIRNKRYLYIRNYMPYVPSGQYTTYQMHMEASKAWLKHHKEGKTDAVTGRFFRTKVVEEFYDTLKDPDNVVNLINDESKKDIIDEMSSELTKWQLEHFDAGLLPEGEMVRLAKKHKTTIYELARNPELYNLKAYLELSEKALQKDAKNIPMFEDNFTHKDIGIRYWSLIGCFMLSKENIDLNKVDKLLKDQSHDIRTMAAWLLYKKGQKDKARSVFKNLLAKKSYATLRILGIIDLCGDDINKYKKEIKKLEPTREVEKFKAYFGMKSTYKMKVNPEPPL